MDAGLKNRAQQAWFSLLWRPEQLKEEALWASGALGGPPGRASSCLQGDEASALPGVESPSRHGPTLV